MDEIKIQLPVILTEKHHLLFTILSAPNNEVLGYSFATVYESNG